MSTESIAFCESYRKEARNRRNRERAINLAHLAAFAATICSLFLAWISIW